MKFSKENLVGHWQSIKVKSRLDYGINWNMTDFWVPGGSARLEITMEQFLFFAPAMDAYTKEERELCIVKGSFVVSKGSVVLAKKKIIITESDRTFTVPVLDFTGTSLSLHIFKTDVVFELV